MTSPRVAQTVARELVVRGHEVRVQTAALGWKSVTEDDAGVRVDRVLTPLLRYNLTFIETHESYMEDEESGNAAALLEWTP